MDDARLEVWDAIARWRAAARRFVLATVVATRGFTPQKGGAHLLVAESGETWGTIGGGAIEREVLERARALLERGGSDRLDRHLTQELGMCCGGEMSVFLEVIERRARLVVFGAGHIAKPLASIAGGCGFDVTVVDARPEWASQERFPWARLEVRAPDEFAREWQVAGDEFVVIVTHDHALDQKLVQALLPRPLRFLGMIGSVPKQRKFALRLKARGFSAEQIARLRTPLGLEIGARTPEEIAVSVVAELIAVRQGRPVEPGWTPPVVGSEAREAREPDSGGAR